MTVELWYGRWPDKSGEQEALVEIYNFLKIQDEHFVLLTQFEAGKTNEIDLCVVKAQGLFLVELKHCAARIEGGKEGPWRGYPVDGEPFTLHPKNSNPYKQVKWNWWHLREWFVAHAEGISAGVVRSEPVDYGALKSFVVIAPNLPAGSDVDIDEGPVQVLGLPEFLTTLMMRTWPKVGLSLQEMRRVPVLLKLTEWRLRESSDQEMTERLEGDWQPASFALLVARGHSYSVPVFRLDQLPQECINIGRDPDNDLVILDKAVSRHHAQLRNAAGRWVVRDLQSDNGTFVSYQGDPAQERQVIGGNENAVKNNSVVRFGPASFTLLTNP